MGECSRKRISNIKTDKRIINDFMLKEKILILGSYGRGNAGDDAFLFSALKLFNNYSLVINSANDDLLPKEIVDKVITISTDGAGDFFKKIILFFQIRYVVYCGGDLFVELHGEKFPRISLWKMLIVNIICKIFNKKVFYLGVGAGDISGFSLFLARISAKLSDFIVTRDSHTIRLLKVKKMLELPDLAINLFETNKTNKKNLKQTIYIGISLLYFLPDPEINFPLVVEEFQSLFAFFDNKDVKFIIIPFFISKHTKHDDLWVSKKLINNSKYKNVEVFNSNKLEDILTLLPQLSLMIGTRLHANILAVLSGIPTLGISYRPKVKSFFTQNKLDEFCINIDEIEKLVPKISMIIDSYPEIEELFLSAQKDLISQKVKYDSIVKKFFN